MKRVGNGVQRRGVAVRMRECRWGQRLGFAVAVDPLAPGGEGDAHRGKLALTGVGQRTKLRHQPSATMRRQAVARIEQPTVALDDSVEFSRRIEACRRRTMTMASTRARAEQDSPAVAPRLHAPLGILPIERSVGTGGAQVGTQWTAAKKRSAAAGGKMLARRVVVRNIGVEQPNAGAIDEPVNETGFLAASVGAALFDLRADRKHIRRAQRQYRRQCLCFDDHVVVEQIHTFVACVRDAHLHRPAESERCARVQKHGCRIALAQCRVVGQGCAIDDHDDFVGLVDVG